MIKCKLGPETKDLQRHHITPLSQGGDRGFLNRMVVCRRHHSLLHGRLIGGLAIKSTRFPKDEGSITREELLRSDFYADLKWVCLSKNGIKRSVDEHCRVVLVRSVLKRWGDRVIMQPSSFSIIVHPKNVKLEHVIKSTEILLRDLRHQLEVEKENKEKV